MKRYIIQWRHKTRDTADHPFCGSGFAHGRTRRKAARAFFNPAFPPMGDRSGLYEIQAAYRAGEIEITEMHRAR